MFDAIAVESTYHVRPTRVVYGPAKEEGRRMWELLRALGINDAKSEWR